MKILQGCLCLVLTAQLALADGLGFYQGPLQQNGQFPFIPGPARVSPSVGHQPYKRVAIVGAGAGGTSAAYFLSKANQPLPEDRQLEITLYEKEEGRIGGRTGVVYPYGKEGEKKGLRPIELGASIFVEVNRNLWRAAQDFNLTITSRGIDEPDSLMGVWDGSQFVYEETGGLGWWDMGKLFWRYGYSPVTTRNLVKGLTDAFLSLYKPSFVHKRSKPHFPWNTVEDFAEALNFTELYRRQAQNWLYENSVSILFIEEIIEAATRVNYATNVDVIHAMGGMVSMAASGASAVAEGNYRIFEEMLVRSGSKVRFGLDGEVTGLIKFPSIKAAYAAGKASRAELQAAEMAAKRSGDMRCLEAEPRWWVGTRSGRGGALYDAVVLATPWHNSGITLLNSHANIPVYPFVHLHVTLLVTNASAPQPEYFGLSKKTAVPKTVLTTYERMRRHDGKAKEKETEEDGGVEANKNADPVLEFNSLNYLVELPRGWNTTIDGGTSTLPKGKLPWWRRVFGRGKTKGSTPADASAAAAEHVVKIFSPERISDEKLVDLFGEGNVLWTLRKEWDSYPKLLPTTTFAPLVPDENLYFVNALERLVSTMETETVSARNVAGLMLKKWFGEEFVHGGPECRWDGDEEREDWAGWGCAGRSKDVVDKGRGGVR